ncbi:MAG TPA: TetR/AcrR family transcriptional regulator [Chloroflexia bacterium]|nr:TetR/AcrR family transcriptional regulator [Chloroflexia bacterium]
MATRTALPAERKRQILDAAASVFSRAGYYEARMDDIADEAGLSKGALYLYFTGKEALSIALVEGHLDHSLRFMEGLVSAEGTVRDRLMSYIRHESEELESMRAILPVCYEFYAAALRQEEAAAFFKSYFRRYLDLLAEMVQQGTDRGELRQADPRQTAILLAGSHEGLTLLWLMDPTAFDWTAQMESGLQLVLDALVV